MSPVERREAEARRLLEAEVPSVPAGIPAEAVRRGERLLRWRRAARRAGWVLLLAAVVVFAVWAYAVHPWTVPPSDTTPPVDSW